MSSQGFSFPYFVTLMYLVVKGLECGLMQWGCNLPGRTFTTWWWALPHPTPPHPPRAAARSPSAGTGALWAAGVTSRGWFWSGCRSR